MLDLPEGITACLFDLDGVLTQAERLFEVRIGGVLAEREHLAGKPARDTFLAGARAVVVQDLAELLER